MILSLSNHCCLHDFQSIKLTLIIPTAFPRAWRKSVFVISEVNKSTAAGSILHTC